MNGHLKFFFLCFNFDFKKYHDEKRMENRKLNTIRKMWKQYKGIYGEK